MNKGNYPDSIDGCHAVIHLMETLRILGIVDYLPRVCHRFGCYECVFR